MWVNQIFCGRLGSLRMVVALINNFVTELYEQSIRDVN